MTSIGHVESLWRYPVKSMQGEELQTPFAGFPGFYGDRVYAFLSSRALKAFPFLTGREQQQMIRYRAVYRSAGAMAMPPNLLEAESLGPGVTAVYADGPDLMVDIETPEGQRFAVD